MPWQTEMVRILRFLIDDTGTMSCTAGITYDFTDSRLEETVLVAAQFVQTEADFDNVYTVDVDTLTLSPDPTTLATKDNAFINLVCLKAALIVVRGLVKTYALQSIRVMDGPSSIDVSGIFNAMKQKLAEMNEDYENTKLQHKMGNAVQAILTPYTMEEVNSYYYPE
jgi:hypothetical protein